MFSFYLNTESCFTQVLAETGDNRPCADNVFIAHRVIPLPMTTSECPSKEYVGSYTCVILFHCVFSFSSSFQYEWSDSKCGASSTGTGFCSPCSPISLAYILYNFTCRYRLAKIYNIDCR